MHKRDCVLPLQTLTMKKCAAGKKGRAMKNSGEVRHLFRTLMLMWRRLRRMVFAENQASGVVLSPCPRATSSGT